MNEVLQFHKEKLIVWALFCIIVFSLVSYMFFINMAVLNTVTLEETENSFATRNAEVSELEFSYISLKNSITLQYAYEKGFVEAKEVHFASRQSPRNLSLNTAE